MKLVCGFLETPYSWNPAWWRGDSHSIGGNRIVSAQARRAPTCPASDSSYLDGKYQGRFHTIFYDARWRTDRRQVRDSVRLYHELGERLEALLHAPGQPDCRQLIDDLHH